MKSDSFIHLGVNTSMTSYQENSKMDHSEDHDAMMATVTELASQVDPETVEKPERVPPKSTRKRRAIDSQSEQVCSNDCSGVLPDAKQCRLDEDIELPQAPSIEEFTKEPTRYSPQVEWLQVSTESATAHFRLMQMVSQDPATTSLPLAKITFGTDRDSALHHCIRNGHIHCARKLILNGAAVDVENVKGVTPLILAAQSGNLAMVRLLEDRGANPSHVTLSGSTAALQAAHFGRLAVLRHLLTKNRQLLELANYHHTTPLMRASQEGHLEVVKFLCEMGASVNRKNMQAMTALMLAAQRGNANVCQYLIQEGADLNAMTQQASTSLVLACKRQHLETVEVLVRAGAELFVKDSRGRTARDIALHRHHSHRYRNDPNANPSEVIQKLTSLLDATVQVDLMRLQARKDRSWGWIRTWALLQQDRARLRGATDVPLHAAIEVVQQRRSLSSSTMAWIRTLALPSALVQHIAEFAPIPSIMDRRVTLLIGRCSADPNAALISCFDLIDEVLEEGGFLAACDQALIPPPQNYPSWSAWKACRLRNARVGLSSGVEMARILNDPPIRPNATSAQVKQPQDPTALVHHRRYAGYLQLLVKYQDRLEPILTNPPYDLRPIVVQQLATSSDICSVVRRLGSHGSCGGFSANVAMDLILFTSRLCGWYIGDAI